MFMESIKIRTKILQAIGGDTLTKTIKTNATVSYFTSVSLPEPTDFTVLSHQAMPPAIFVSFGHFEKYKLITRNGGTRTCVKR